MFIIFLISIHIISFADYESEKENYNYYGNDWDNFYTYIQDKLNNDKNGNGYIDSNSISDKDIDRYLAGPTKEDKANGIPLFGDADTISMYSEILRNYKSARADKKESNWVNDGIWWNDYNG